MAAAAVPAADGADRKSNDDTPTNCTAALVAATEVEAEAEPAALRFFLPAAASGAGGACSSVSRSWIVTFHRAGGAGDADALLLPLLMRRQDSDDCNTRLLLLLLLLL